MHYWRPLPKIQFDLLPSFSPKMKAYLQFFVQLVGLSIQMLTIKILDQPAGSFFGMYQAAGGNASGDVGIRVEGPLQYVRHPIMTGFFFILWSAPAASRGRLLYNFCMSTYIATAVFLLEEPALVHALGRSYQEYQKEVPRAFLPFF